MLKRSIGITITATHCYIAQLIKEKKSWCCQKISHFPHQNDHLNALIHIKQSIKHQEKVIYGISENSVKIQNMAVDADLSDQEIIKYLSAKISDRYFDYQITKSNNTATSLKVISASEATIEPIIKLFSNAKIMLSVIDINRLALARFKKRKAQIINLPKQFDSIYSLICIGLAVWSKSYEH